MDTIRLKDHGPNQCVVMLGNRNIAYICYGEGMPINWLPRPASGVRLTDAEKLAAAKEIRKLMANRKKAVDDVSQELAEISGRNYKPKAEDATQQGSNTRGENKPPKN